MWEKIDCICGWLVLPRDKRRKAAVWWSFLASCWKVLFFSYLQGLWFFQNPGTLDQTCQSCQKRSSGTFFVDRNGFPANYIIALFKRHSCLQSIIFSQTISHDTRDLLYLSLHHNAKAWKFAIWYAETQIYVTWKQQIYSTSMGYQAYRANMRLCWFNVVSKTYIRHHNHVHILLKLMPINILVDSARISLDSKINTMISLNVNLRV